MRIGGRIVALRGEPIEPAGYDWDEWVRSERLPTHHWQRDLLNDGMAGQYRINSGYGEPTVEIAGDGPAPIAGVAISLRAWSGPLGGALRDYRIVTSLDGTTFVAAANGTLEAIPERQHIVFNAPVPARFARIVDQACEGADDCRSWLAEVMVIAQPGHVPQGLRPPDPADPLWGGHIVSGTDPGSAQGRWTDGLTVSETPVSYNAERVAAREADPFARWTLGFREGRAVEIASLTWAGEVREDMVGGVRLSAYADGAAGPFVALGRLERPAPGETSTLTLDAPVWARFVRIEMDPFEGDAYAPDVIRIAPTARGVAALGLWDEMDARGPYEALGLAPDRTMSEPAGGASADAAVPLALDAPLASSVVRGGNEDWFGVEMPASPQPTAILRVWLRHPFLVEAGVRLEDASGAPIPLRPIETFRETLPDLFPPLPEGAPDPDDVWPAGWPCHIGRAYDLAAEVAPGETYRGRVFEGGRSVTAFREISGFMTRNLPALRRGYRALADALGEEDAVSFPRANPRFADKDGFVTGRAEALRALASGTVSRGETTSDFGVALRRETGRLEFREGAKAMTFAGFGNGIGRDYLRDMSRGVVRADALITTCDDEARCSDQRVAEDRPRDVARIARGTVAYLDRPEDVEEMFARLLARVRGPKAYEIEVSALSPPVEEIAPQPVVVPEPGIVLPDIVPEPKAPTRALLTLLLAADGDGARGPTGEGLADPARNDAGPLPPAVGVIVDASGSMRQRLDGRRRIEIARAALTDLVGAGLPEPRLSP